MGISPCGHTQSLNLSRGAQKHQGSGLFVSDEGIKEVLFDALVQYV